MQARLSATELACRRGDRVLFRALGFELEAGESLHVAGPNGIGKTSLLRIMAGLLRPFGGSFASQGEVGLIDERPALDHDQPLGKALQFWAELDRVEPDTLEASTNRMKLSALLDVPVGYLSTGQRKRAAMARLLGQSAPIWLLDEPLSGLDSKGIALMTELIAEHCAQGGLAAIASHQPLDLAGLRTLPLEEYAA